MPAAVRQNAGPMKGISSQWRRSWGDERRKRLLIDGVGYLHDLEQFALSGYFDAVHLSMEIKSRLCACAPWSLVLTG